MSRTNKNRQGGGWLVRLFLGFGALALYLWHFMSGKNVAVLDSQGSIAQQQHDLLIKVVVILLIATVPVVLMLYFTAWKYRETSPKIIHHPTSKQGKPFEFFIWGFPFMFLVIFMFIMVPATHRLEPRKAIASSNKTLTIQVIAMRWKWLFLYPDQKVASVNYVKIPKDTPVEFELTADDTPMSSFWIPNLGGQLYAMTGHVNRLNLMATKDGNYRGSTAEINGAGFSSMLFTASVGSDADFTSWVQKTKQGSQLLDTAAYNKLVLPSEHNAVALYGSYQNDLYDTVTTKYMDGMHMHSTSVADEGGQ
jgi:cytochrome o ubiquinol oxidase subunit 2